MVNNPIYDESHDSPFYEQVQPFKRLNSTSSHSNLDSPGHRLPSPTQSATSPTAPLYNNNHTATSPGSTTSNNAFMWPYSAVQSTNAATFDAIEADVNRVTQTRAPLPSSTPGEESYMTMQSAANQKNVQNITSGQPRYAIDIHGNQYIEC